MHFTATMAHDSAKTTATARKPRPEEILREAAAHLKKERPAMSLRAVAARMEISPSYWSKILRGEKPLPENILPKVVKTLGLDAQQIARLQRSILDTIESERLAPVTGLRVAREERSPIEAYRNLGREDFWMLREWYFIPLLNALTLTEPPRDAAALAGLLGIRLDQAESAVRKARLHGFIEEREGQLHRTGLQFRFPTDRSHGDVRQYHRAMLQRAHKELADESSPGRFDQRQISAVCFAGSAAKLREAQMILEEAMYRAANLMAGEPLSDEVYQINLQLMPLTTRRR